ncbi:hypothetical protein HP532_16475 [Pseudomonas sp. CrR25]|nr:hypothetical protein [Pseudomonas sp. CrR25]
MKRYVIDRHSSHDEQHNRIEPSLAARHPHQVRDDPGGGIRWLHAATDHKQFGDYLAQGQASSGDFPVSNFSKERRALDPRRAVC